MKVLIVAHTNDENGQHVPGDIVEISEGEAKAYADKNWGIVLPDEAKPSARAAIETPEDALSEHETAEIKRKKK